MNYVPFAMMLTGRTMMIKKLPLLSTMIACALLLGVQSRCVAQADMTGYWKFSVPNGGNLGGHNLRARDLWTHTDVKVEGDTFTASVPKHGVVLLKVFGGSIRSR